MKFYIKTYGCQMNERDSEAAGAMLEARGHTMVDTEEEADILIFNTCSVRDQAERKAIGKIGIMQRLKRRKPDIYIGVMGCMAQSRGQELIDTIPHLDFVVGTEQLHRLPEIIDGEIRKRHPEVCIEHDDTVLTGLDAHASPDTGTIAAFIAIMRGCNRFCSYCIVPHVRGREKSREIADITREARKLVKNGIREIMLLGQNVAAFGLDGNINPPDDDNSPFADLLRELNGIEGLKRIRFTSPYPSYFNKKLINAIATLPKVCNSIHIPLQSGSDRVLKLMNRHYTSSQYLDIINRMKAAIPGITFSTDIIVGFPGETDEDFNATRDLMNEVGFDNAFIFKYSPRRDTPAATMPDQVEQKAKEARNQILLQDLAARTKDHNAAYVDKTVEVLAEGPSKRNAKRWAGRTTNNKVVIFTPTEECSIGDILNVKITRTTSMTLFGDVI